MTLSEILNAPDTKLVDVRSPLEFNMGHAKGAINIPLDQFQSRYREINGLGKSAVVCYCRSGARSSQAVAYLQQLGFGNIYNGGGLDNIELYLN